MTACLTADDAYTAGYRDGENDPPLTTEQSVRIALIVAASPSQEARSAA